MPERRLDELLERAVLASRLVTGDPALLGDYLRWFVSDRFAPTRIQPSRPQQPPTVSLDEARAHIRATVSQYEDGPGLELVRRFWEPAPKRGSAADAQALSMAGDTSLGELVYGLVRALRPAVVVETGVATGVTSAYILAALADNDRGHLSSIDLPPTRMVTARLVGIAVPPALRHRWTYYWGASRRLLPRVLDSLPGQVDVFVHDSDHRYAAMRWELEVACAALQPLGWLVADDATLHSAVDDVARVVGADPLYVRQVLKPDATAMLRKTPIDAAILQEVGPRARGTSR